MTRTSRTTIGASISPRFSKLLDRGFFFYPESICLMQRDADVGGVNLLGHRMDILIDKDTQEDQPVVGEWFRAGLGSGSTFPLERV